MKHKYFHCLDLSIVPYPQTTYTTLRAARDYAKTLPLAWVGTIDGAIDERWQNGERVQRRTTSGTWIVTKGAPV